MIGKIFQQGVEQYALICLRRPILVVALVSLALVVLAVITSVTGQLETEAYGGVEWLVKTDLETKRWFGAQKVSTEAISVQRGGPSEDSASSERVRSAQAYPVTFVYSTTEDNVFVPGYLESIRKVFPARSIVVPAVYLLGHTSHLWTHRTALSCVYR